MRLQTFMCLVETVGCWVQLYSGLCTAADSFGRWAAASAAARTCHTLLLRNSGKVCTG
jgi:hypothetical protein